MKTTLCTLAAILTAALPLSAGPATLHTVPAETIEAALSDQGDAPLVIVCTPGEAYTFLLDENATTGYRWLAEGVDECVSVSIAPDEQQKPEPGLCGAPRKACVTLTALKPGEACITLLYARSWEKPLKPVRSLSIHVTVEDPAARKYQP